MRYKHKASSPKANDHCEAESDQHGSGFLTKAQQDILDAAVVDKQKLAHLERAKSHSEEKSFSRQPSQGAGPPLKDRASRSRSDKLVGNPKKHGAGGKYNWGGTLDAEAVSGVQDPHDPNYDSGTEDVNETWTIENTESPAHHAHDPNLSVITILQEYLLTGDQVEAIASLQGSLRSSQGAWAVKKLVTIAMDHRDRERELASQLLSSMYNTVVSPTELEKGFNLLVKSTEDLCLDVPQAVDLLALFLSRAIVDEILPPAFALLPNSEINESGRQVLDKAAHLLKAPHSAERLQNCWGCVGAASYAHLVTSISSTLQEYLESNDFKEAQLCLSKIDAPLAMHEVVKQALVKAMSCNSQSQMLSLLGKLAEEGSIPTDQLAKGYKRIESYLDDLALDIPDAKRQFPQLIQYGISQNWFSPSDLGNYLPDDRSKLEHESAHDSARDSAKGALSEPAHESANGAVSERSTEAKHRSWNSELQAFKREVREATAEYFGSADLQEATRRLQSLEQPGFHSLAVKQIVQMALEAKDREREMTAKLLVELKGVVIPEAQVTLGFKRLLASAEDMVLDIPEAPHHLSIFLGRAIVDELLPPSFLTNALDALSNGSLGIDIIQAAGNMLKRRHAAQRLQDCWQPNSDVYNARSKIQALLTEFLATGDDSEAAKRWRELGMPFYAHQLVFAILTASFGNAGASDKLFRLLGRLLDSGEISETQLEMGFDRVQAQLADLELDFPQVATQFARCKTQAEELHWLPAALPDGNV